MVGVVNITVFSFNVYFVGGMGIGMTVSRTLHHQLFLEDPHAAAKDVWESSGLVSLL